MEKGAVHMLEFFKLLGWRVKDTPADLHTEYLAWDKETTHMRDRESYLPVQALHALAAEGRLGGVPERFHLASQAVGRGAEGYPLGPELAESAARRRRGRLAHAPRARRA